WGAGRGVRGGGGGGGCCGAGRGVCGCGGGAGAGAGAGGAAAAPSGGLGVSTAGASGAAAFGGAAATWLLYSAGSRRKVYWRTRRPLVQFNSIKRAGNGSSTRRAVGRPMKKRRSGGR